MKTLKRIWFVILVLLNLTILFVPEMIYWIFKGHGFLSDRLNRLYAKWVLPLLFLFILSCENPKEYDCKDCTYFEDGQNITAFVCGETLMKFERDGYKCTHSSKN